MEKFYMVWSWKYGTDYNMGSFKTNLVQSRMNMLMLITMRLDKFSSYRAKKGIEYEYAILYGAPCVFSVKWPRRCKYSIFNTWDSRTLVSSCFPFIPLILHHYSERGIGLLNGSWFLF